MFEDTLVEKVIENYEVTHHIPVLVEVVDAGDAASVTVWVVHMFDVTGPITWVTRHHGLKTHTETQVMLNDVILSITHVTKFHSLIECGNCKRGT